MLINSLDDFQFKALKSGLKDYNVERIVEFNNPTVSPWQDPFAIKMLYVFFKFNDQIFHYIFPNDISKKCNFSETLLDIKKSLEDHISGIEEHIYNKRFISDPSPVFWNFLKRDIFISHLLNFHTIENTPTPDLLLNQLSTLKIESDFSSCKFIDIYKALLDINHCNIKECINLDFLGKSSKSANSLILRFF